MFGNFENFIKELMDFSSREPEKPKVENNNCFWYSRNDYHIPENLQNIKKNGLENCNEKLV